MTCHPKKFKDISCYYCGTLADWTDLETRRPTCGQCKEAVTPSTRWQGGRPSRWAKLWGRVPLQEILSDPYRALMGGKVVL